MCPTSARMRRTGILRDINEMTKRRFALARHLRDTRPWDFFMMVEMGPDRLHHGFWRYYDPKHPDYEPGTAYETAFRDYYRYLDSEIGSLIDGLDDDTALMVVSDHGAQSMFGGIQVNEWLMREGYLTLAEQPAAPGPIGKMKIDWPQHASLGRRRLLLAHLSERAGTRAGGHHRPGRLRERPRRADREAGGAGGREGRLDRHPRIPAGAALPQVNGVAPDLICYFGNLTWRSIGSVGDGRIHVRENDTGPDDANHAKFGIYIMAGPGMPASPPASATLFDVAPTVLSLLGQPVPSDMQGHSLV